LHCERAARPQDSQADPEKDIYSSSYSGSQVIFDQRTGLTFDEQNSSRRNDCGSSYRQLFRARRCPRLDCGDGPSSSRIRSGRLPQVKSPAVAANPACQPCGRVRQGPSSCILHWHCLRESAVRTSGQRSPSPIRTAAANGSHICASSGGAYRDSTEYSRIGYSWRDEGQQCNRRRGMGDVVHNIELIDWH
jgi:hypothetical protein